MLCQVPVTRDAVERAVRGALGSSDGPIAHVGVALAQRELIVLAERCAAR